MKKWEEKQYKNKTCEENEVMKMKRSKNKKWTKTEEINEKWYLKKTNSINEPLPRLIFNNRKDADTGSSRGDIAILGH